MKLIRNSILLLLLSATMSFAQGLPAAMDQEITNMLTAKFPADGSGATALVARDGKIVYKKAFGMANIELNVPMQPDMIFRIGSITKQFTAVAILQLMEQGKLDLQDEITKYIPDYPTGGNKITIEHLLTHTSGIKSYTGMKEFAGAITLNKTPIEVINFFKDQPMDFKPGEKYKYNNSGYFLLGYIIQKVSGQSYPEYIEEKIFKPLGMTNSSYGSDAKLIKNRAAGYGVGAQGAVNADPMSMDLPYAAGSLLSTVEDLLKWNTALHAGRVIKESSLDKALTPYKLTSGAMTTYGYGLGIGILQGSVAISHGGGINGFLTYAVYLPKEKLFIVVLSNSTGKSPDEITRQIAALAIGKPIAPTVAAALPAEPKTVDVAETVLEKYVGDYQIAPNFILSVTRKGKELFTQATGQQVFQVFPESEKLFFVKIFPAKLEFVTDSTGKATAVIMHQNGQKTNAPRK